MTQKTEHAAYQHPVRFAFSAHSVPSFPAIALVVKVKEISFSAFASVMKMIILSEKLPTKSVE